MSKYIYSSQGELFAWIEHGIHSFLCGGAVARVVRRVPSNQEGAGSNPVHGTTVLQQDNLSTLLLSTQEYKWVAGRM